MYYVRAINWLLYYCGINYKIGKEKKNYTETATAGRSRWRGTVRPNGRLPVRRLPLQYHKSTLKTQCNRTGAPWYVKVWFWHRPITPNEKLQKWMQTLHSGAFSRIKWRYVHLRLPKYKVNEPSICAWKGVVNEHSLTTLGKCGQLPLPWLRTSAVCV